LNTILIIFSANAEWQAAKTFYSDPPVQKTPFGEFFALQVKNTNRIYLQGGWGKISAAASLQYGLLRWSPELVINIGTCGGFEGRVESGTILLVDQTCVYDIIEQMGDPQEALDYYSVNLDLNWLKTPYPQAVKRCMLLSADRDIIPEEIPRLIEKFGGIAADWESGAIAWVCQQNAVRCLILRGVSDIVGTIKSQAYGELGFFQQASQKIVHEILAYLDKWIVCSGIHENTLDKN